MSLTTAVDVIQLGEHRHQHSIFALDSEQLLESAYFS